jgi:hypothetical protein
MASKNGTDGNERRLVTFFIGDFPNQHTRNFLSLSLAVN